MVTEAEYDRVQTLLDEYAQRRGKLLNEKAALEKLINEADYRLEQQLKMSEETFEIACTAQKRFAEGDTNIKKEVPRRL